MQKAPHYAQLLDSIRQSGQILPVYLWSGGVLDGAQRQMACWEAGIQPDCVTLDTREQAAALLFSLHPERAIHQFGEGLTITQQCALFAARPREIAAARRAAFPAPEAARKWPRNYSTGKQTVTLPVREKQRLVTLCTELRCSQQDLIICSLQVALPQSSEIKAALTKMRILGLDSQRGRRGRPKR